MISHTFVTRCRLVSLAYVLGFAACGSNESSLDGSSGQDAGDAGKKPFVKGPVVTVIDNATGKSYQTCTGRIAETRFGNALCTCGNTRVAAYLKTRSLDSSAPSGTGGSTDIGGTVGINQSYVASAGYTDVGGSMAIAGSASLSLAGYLKVGTDFRAAGDATVAGRVDIGRNAWFGGKLTALGPATVGGDLHASANVMALPLVVKGTHSQESVVIAPPCPCETRDVLNVASIIDDGRVHNDNDSAGIEPDQFHDAVGNVYATLPSGRFFVDAITGVGNIAVTVTGKTALFVDDSVAVTGNLEFKLAPGAEIDIFVRNTIVLTGRSVFGTKDRPAATRIYVSGSDDVLLVGDQFVANLYGPRALLKAVGFLDVWGSVFVRDFVVPGYANFHYDRAIQKAGESCNEPPPPACNKCGSCTNGKACVNGVCGPCRTDSDCCGQMMCAVGRCMWADLRP